MGKEKLISQVFMPRIGKKRYLIMTITSLVLGLMLQGCGGQGATGLISETEIPFVEEVQAPPPTEEVQEPLPIEGVPVERSTAPDWCASEGDLYQELPAIDENAEGITVEICITGGESYTIETYEGNLEDLEFTKGLDRPFDIYAFLTYFKVKDGDEIKTTFEYPLQMRITYSNAAWNAILERDYEVPRIAYLPWVGAEWAEEWFELGVEEKNIHPPLEDGADGYLDIFIDELPDPLIGSC